MSVEKIGRFFTKIIEVDRVLDKSSDFLENFFYFENGITFLDE